MRNTEPSFSSGFLFRVLLIAAFLIVLTALLPACQPSQQSAPTPDQAAAKQQEPYVAASKGRIDIEGGLVKLAAKRDGVIHLVLVEEGNRVKTGQILLVLDDKEAKLSAELSRAELHQAQAAIPPLQVKLAAAEREFKRLSPLASEDTVERRELDLNRDQVLLLKREIEAAQAAVETAAMRLKVAEFEVEQRVVRAPDNGRIVRRSARPGDGVSTLNVTQLFLFAPEIPRIVRAELEERFIPQVKPGQSADVVLEADESHHFKATVTRIGLVVGQRTPSDDPKEKQDNRVVECVLSIDAPDLLVGQRVIVRFQKG